MRMCGSPGRRFVGQIWWPGEAECSRFRSRLSPSAAVVPDGSLAAQVRPRDSAPDGQLQEPQPDGPQAGARRLRSGGEARGHAPRPLLQQVGSRPEGCVVANAPRLALCLVSMPSDSRLLSFSSFRPRPLPFLSCYMLPDFPILCPLTNALKILPCSIKNI